jgi:hypothetical protein
MRDLRSPLDGIRSPFGVARGWTPASLFGASDEGVWLNPSVGGSVFTNTQGTILASTPGPAGLVLDQRHGTLFNGTSFQGTTGGNVILNGTFGTSDNWTLGTGWDISGGSLNYDGTDASNIAQPVGTSLESDVIYALEFDLTISQGVLNVRPSVASPTDSVSFTSGGRVAAVLIGSGATPGFQAGNFGGRFIGSIDNLSITKLPGIHALQRISPYRPTYNSGPLRLTDDEFDDSLNWNAPAGTYTIARVNDAGTVTIQTGQVLSGATDIFVESEIAGYVAIDRALTAGETAKLTAYLEGLV